MTNRIALWLGLFLLAAFGVDILAFDGWMTLFLGKQLVDATEYIAFWR